MLLARAMRLAGASQSVLAGGDQRQPMTEREGVGPRKTATRFCLERHQCMSLSFRYQIHRTRSDPQVFWCHLALGIDNPPDSGHGLIAHVE